MRFGKWFGRRKETIPDISLLADGVPQRILKLNGQRQEGPNCWNATIMFFDQREQVRFTDRKVMVDWLSANTIEDTYKLCPVGSILVLYGEDELLSHSAVWVAPGILFHKRGIGGHWEFVTERQLMEIYFETTRREYRLLKD